MNRLLAIREEVLARVPVLPGERVTLGEGTGRWLAAPALAAHAFPSFACSAMDGYALRSGDSSGPAVLRVVRTIYAGEEPGAAIGPGEAARIFTGAPVPPGADAVVREEATTESAGRVLLRAAVESGENVRQAGEDLERGERALDAGTFLGARQLALLTAVGLERVDVVRLPRVALISTGDELVLGRTPNSNGAAIATALRSMGAQVGTVAVGDDLDAITRAIGEGLAAADAVITIGGVSIGAHDHVPAAIARVGGAVHVHGVPMKPGKPFLFAIAEGKPAFGLPGSPSACLVAFEVFARPALLRMAGASRPFRRTVWLPVAERVSGRPGRSRFLWARLEPDGRVRPIGRDAAQVRGPALADVLLHLHEGAGDVEEGAPVEAWLLEEHVP